MPLLCIQWNSILCEFVHFFVLYSLSLSHHFFYSVFRSYFFLCAGSWCMPLWIFFPFPIFICHHRQWHILHFTYFVMSIVRTFSLHHIVELTTLNNARNVICLRSNIVIFSNQKQISFSLALLCPRNIDAFCNCHAARGVNMCALLLLLLVLLLLRVRFFHNFHLHKCHKLGLMPNACQGKMKTKIGCTC